MEALIDQCTSEKRTEDDWDLILRICDEYGSSEPKLCVKYICRRVFHKNPNISLRAIALLDACSKNCGKAFNRELASREFSQLVKSKFSGLQRIPKMKLIDIFQKWSEKLKSDSELALASELFSWVTSQHPDVLRGWKEERQVSDGERHRESAKQMLRQEDEELAKAIALSLKEVTNITAPHTVTTHKPSGSTANVTAAQPCITNTTSALYPSVSVQQPQPIKSIGPVATPRPKSDTVRALYDFEAAEDNELTFKAGELIVLLDDSDENWWRGSNHRGEGLFPAQFVKLVGESVNDKVKVKSDPNEGLKSLPTNLPVKLNESKLDECLRLISMVDPTGEYRPDPPELAPLEAECNAMTPLVDPELEKVDNEIMKLSDIHQRLMDAFQTYHYLMSKPPAPPVAHYTVPGVVPGSIPMTSYVDSGMYEPQHGLPTPYSGPSGFVVPQALGQPGAVAGMTMYAPYAETAFTVPPTIGQPLAMAPGTMPIMTPAHNLPASTAAVHYSSGLDPTANPPIPYTSSNDVYPLDPYQLGQQIEPSGMIPGSAEQQQHYLPGSSAAYYTPHANASNPYSDLRHQPTMVSPSSNPMG